MEKRSRQSGNALLQLLPSEVSGPLLVRAEPLKVTSGKVIAAAEQPIRNVFFPTTAVLSVMSILPDRSGIETAVVGNEGMAPLGAFHQVETAAEQIVAQVPGEVLRLDVADFRASVAELPALRTSLHRFSQALFTFASQTSACNRKHSVVQRAARWLLVTHDRVPGDEFELTHAFLSHMLGVRRSSVTVAAEALRAAGAIEYSRGKVRVVNRALLYSKACDCYDIIRSSYDRLIDGSPTPSPLADLTPFDSYVSTVGVRGETAVSPAEAISLALDQLQLAEEELRVQVEAMEELRRSLETRELQWRSRLEGLPDAFIETGPDDAITEVNRAAEELLGRDRQQLLRKKLVGFVAEAERKSFEGVIAGLRQRPRGMWSGMLNGRAQHQNVDVTVAAASQPQDLEAREPDSSGAGPTFCARWLVRLKNGPTAR